MYQFTVRLKDGSKQESKHEQQPSVYKIGQLICFDFYEEGENKNSVKETISIHGDLIISVVIKKIEERIPLNENASNQPTI